MSLKLKEIQMSAVSPQDIEWIWKDRFPLGKLSLIAGAPGLGKSLVTLNMAARISTGDSWPDGSFAPVGRSILFSAEDDPSDTVLPRLMAAGADLSKISAVQTVIDSNGREGPVVFPAHIDLLNQILKESKGVKLVVIDPVGAYMGSIDTHRESSVRSIMYPLSVLAERYDVAIVGVVHLNKASISTEQSAINRVMGSIAFVGAARCVWGIIEDTDNPERKLMCCIKNNLSQHSNKALEFIIDSMPLGPCVMWGTSVACGHVDDMFKGGDKMQKAVDFLQEILSDGPVKAKEIREESNLHGINDRTLDRAKQIIGVVAKRVRAEENGKVFWQWELSE